MADIELVIKIDEKCIKQIEKIRFLIGGKEDRNLQINVINAIKNGIPIQKGHGDLVDRDAINDRFDSIYDEAMGCSCVPTYKYLLDKFNMCLGTAQIIIEADNEESKEE